MQIKLNEQAGIALGGLCPACCCFFNSSCMVTVLVGRQMAGRDAKRHVRAGATCWGQVSVRECMCRTKGRPCGPQPLLHS